MGQRYVTNDTPNTIYENGRMIPPGEGRHVDFPDEQLPHQDDNNVPNDGDALLVELLKNNVKAVQASLEGLSKSTLLRLQDLENAADKPRKGVIEAIVTALLTIANAELESDDLGESSKYGAGVAVGGGDGSAVGE